MVNKYGWRLSLCLKITSACFAASHQTYKFVIMNVTSVVSDTVVEKICVKRKSRLW